MKWQISFDDGRPRTELFAPDDTRDPVPHRTMLTVEGKDYVVTAAEPLTRMSELTGKHFTTAWALIVAPSDGRVSVLETDAARETVEALCYVLDKARSERMALTSTNAYCTISRTRIFKDLFSNRPRADFPSVSDLGNRVIAVDAVLTPLLRAFDNTTHSGSQPGQFDSVLVAIGLMHAIACHVSSSDSADHSDSRGRVTFASDIQQSGTHWAVITYVAFAPDGAVWTVTDTAELYCWLIGASNTEGPLAHARALYLLAELLKAPASTSLTIQDKTYSVPLDFFNEGAVRGALGLIDRLRHQIKRGSLI